MGLGGPWTVVPGSQGPREQGQHLEVGPGSGGGWARGRPLRGQQLGPRGSDALPHVESSRKRD